MKRILFCHQVSTIGGASYCLLAMIRALDKSKFSPIVMLFNEGPLADEFRKMEVEVVIFPEMATVPYNQSLLMYDTIPTYLRAIAAQKRFGELVRETDVDVVYLNNMMLYPYLKTAKSNGCRTIMHVREHWPHDKHKVQMKIARHYADRYCDSVIAINHYSASMFPECKDRTTIVYDWFNEKDRYEKLPLDELLGEETEKLKVMLFTGGIGRIKGTHEVIRAFSNHIKGDEYRLIVMGSGTDYQLNFAGKTGLIKRMLMMTGWEPYGYKVMKAIKADSRIVIVPPTYNMVDIYRQVYCTLSYFTIPHANLALAEALSLGTAGIAAETEESLEYTNNGNGAVLFKLNDFSDFTNKIDCVLSDYENVKQRAMDNAEIVKKMFSPETNIDKFNQVCEMV